MAGRRTRLLDDYYELRESGSTSDFPNILGNLMYRSLIDWARTVPDVWRSYSAIGDATDFRPLTRIIGNEAEDLIQVLEDGNYVDSKLGDAKYQVQLNTYGRGSASTATSSSTTTWATSSSSRSASVAPPPARSPTSSR